MRVESGPFRPVCNLDRIASVPDGMVYAYWGSGRWAMKQRASKSWVIAIEATYIATLFGFVAWLVAALNA